MSDPADGGIEDPEMAIIDGATDDDRPRERHVLGELPAKSAAPPPVK